MSSWGFAFTPILLKLLDLIYRNGEVQSFHFGETGDDALSGYTSSL
jgi:hypothetical protein